LTKDFIRPKKEWTDCLEVNNLDYPYNEKFKKINVWAPLPYSLFIIKLLKYFRLIPHHSDPKYHRKTPLIAQCYT